MLMCRKTVILRPIKHWTHSRSFHDADSVTERIKVAGYQGEYHRTKTDDGYVLKIHRVLPKQHSDFKGSAFLMHGLFRNATDFISSGPKTALAYYLADNGFDVWLGNSRGTKYSSHEYLPAKSADFWNFSFHEMGLYDLPAMLDCMLENTNRRKTFYIGHSQGTSQLIALLASRPEYNEKIIEAHLLTPAVIMKRSVSPALTLSAKFPALFMSLARKLPNIDISFLLKMSFKMCNYNGFNPDIAMKLYKSMTCKLVGENKQKVRIAEDALRNLPLDMSPKVATKQLAHFLQLHMSGKFQQYDHGQTNLIRYNTSNPPLYRLDKVTAPLHLYAASEDLLISHTDVDHLRTLLPNVKSFEVLEDWNHMDVMLGRDSRELLYAKIIKAMNLTVDNKVR